MHGQFEHKIKVTLNIHSVRLIPTTFLDILHRITVLLHVRTTANQTSNFLSSVLSFQCIFELVKRRMNSEKVSYNRFRIFGFPICVQKQSLKYIEIKFFVVVCMSVKLVLSCWRRNVGKGCLRIEWWEVIGRKKNEGKGSGVDCVIRIFIIFNSNPILLGCSNQENGQGMCHILVYGGQKCF